MGQLNWSRQLPLSVSRSKKFKYFFFGFLLCVLNFSISVAFYFRTHVTCSPVFSPSTANSKNKRNRNNSELQTVQYANCQQQKNVSQFSVYLTRKANKRLSKTSNICCCIKKK